MFQNTNLIGYHENSICCKFYAHKKYNPFIASQHNTTHIHDMYVYNHGLRKYKISTTLFSTSYYFLTTLNAA